jgi:hypothetical protein
LLMLPTYSDIFSTVSPSLTTSINSTVLFSFSLLSSWRASEEFLSPERVFKADIYVNWYSWVFRMSFMVSLRAIRSEPSIVELSILGTSFITKFYNSFRRTIIFVYKLLCRYS